MLRGIGTSKLAGNFAAEKRRNLNLQVVAQRGNVKTGKMKNFCDLAGFEQLLQVRGFCLAEGDSQNGDAIVAIAQLHQTEPIAVGQETHRFRINCDRIRLQIRRQDGIGKIAIANLKVLQLYSPTELHINSHSIDRNRSLTKIAKHYNRTCLRNKQIACISVSR